MAPLYFPNKKVSIRQMSALPTCTSIVMPGWHREAALVGVPVFKFHHPEHSTNTQKLFLASSF